MSPAQKASLACVSFGSIATVGWFLTSFTGESLPLLLYYAALLINTFFSVRTFSVITPHNWVQMSFDGVLAIVYVALAFSFGSVLMFCAVSAGLFFIAIAKYLHLRHLIGAKGLLPHKIKINALGALLSLMGTAVAMYGHPLIAAWFLAGVFSVANVYLLVVNPMYESHG